MLFVIILLPISSLQTAIAQVSCGGIDETAACLKIRVAVLNNNGGNATPYDFKLHVATQDGQNISVRGDPSGALIPLNFGRYSVTPDPIQGYTIRTISNECNGVINNLENHTRLCTVIYDDNAPLITITVQTDKENYYLGETVRISGTVTGIDPSGQTQTVKLHIFTMDSSPSFDTTESTTVASDGTFIYNFSPSVTNPFSYYRIIASYNDGTQDGQISSKAGFSVKPPSSHITVQADKQSYNIGDKITISGRVTEGIVPDSLVSVNVLDSDGHTVYSKDDISIDQQSGSYSLQPNELMSVPAGGYSIAAEYNNANATSSFIIQRSIHTPPDTKILLAAGSDGKRIEEGARTDSQSLKFTFMGIGEQSNNNQDYTFQCRLDGSDGNNFESCTTPFSVFPKNEGRHTFEVRAIDNESNIDPTPARFEWTTEGIIITVPPTIVADPNNEQGKEVTFNVTAQSNGVAITPDCSPESGSLFAIGKTTVHCTASDIAGNIANQSFDVIVKEPFISYIIRIIESPVGIIIVVILIIAIAVAIHYLKKPPPPTTTMTVITRGGIED